MPPVVSHARGGVSRVVLSLLDITIDVEQLQSAGIDVAWVDGAPRILGELPMSSEVIVAEHPIAC